MNLLENLTKSGFQIDWVIPFPEDYDSNLAEEEFLPTKIG